MIRICAWCKSLIRRVWEYCPVCGPEDYDLYIDYDYDSMWVDIGGEGGGA